MADRILPFEPREQNILRFPSTATERKNLELHRLLDQFIESGHEQMISAHFEAWGSYYLGKQRPELRTTRDTESEKKRPAELTPDEQKIKSDPRAFLPRVSGFIEEPLFRKFRNILSGNKWHQGTLDLLRVRAHEWYLDALDRRSNVSKIFYCREAWRDKVGSRTAEDMFAQHVCSLSYCNVNRLVANKIKPEYISEAIAEIQSELAYLPKISQKCVRPEMRGEDRIAVTRFNEWLVKEKEDARRSCL